MTSTNYMSEESLEKLKVELDRLKNVRRKEISERIGIAKDQGDLSENFDYQEAKEEQGANERQISDIEQSINAAVLIEQKSGGSSISVGTSFVTETADGVEKHFEIVGATESDPMTGKISNESPLGNAFLGKSVGDRVTFNAPGGEISYKIVEIK